MLQHPTLTQRHLQVLAGCVSILHADFKKEYLFTPTTNRHEEDGYLVIFDSETAFFEVELDFNDLNSIGLFLADDEDSPLVSVNTYLEIYYPELSPL